MKLKSCPNCGKAPIIRHYGDQEGGNASVECTRCGISVAKWNDSNSFLAEEKAVRVWNKIGGCERTMVEVKRYDDANNHEDIS